MQKLFGRQNKSKSKTTISAAKPAQNAAPSKSYHSPEIDDPLYLGAAHAQFAPTQTAGLQHDVRANKSTAEFMADRFWLLNPDHHQAIVIGSSFADRYTDKPVASHVLDAAATKGLSGKDNARVGLIGVVSDGLGHPDGIDEQQKIAKAAGLACSNVIRMAQLQKQRGDALYVGDHITPEMWSEIDADKSDVPIKLPLVALARTTRHPAEAQVQVTDKQRLNYAATMASAYVDYTASKNNEYMAYLGNVGDTLCVVLDGSDLAVKGFVAARDYHMPQMGAPLNYSPKSFTELQDQSAVVKAEVNVKPGDFIVGLSDGVWPLLPHTTTDSDEIIDVETQGSTLQTPKYRESMPDADAFSQVLLKAVKDLYGKDDATTISTSELAIAINTIATDATLAWRRKIAAAQTLLTETKIDNKTLAEIVNEKDGQRIQALTDQGKTAREAREQYQAFTVNDLIDFAREYLDQDKAEILNEILDNHIHDNSNYDHEQPAALFIAGLQRYKIGDDASIFVLQTTDLLYEKIRAVVSLPAEKVVEYIQQNLPIFTAIKDYNLIEAIFSKIKAERFIPSAHEKLTSTVLKQQCPRFNPADVDRRHLIMQVLVIKNVPLAQWSNATAANYLCCVLNSDGLFAKADEFSARQAKLIIDSEWYQGLLDILTDANRSNNLSNIVKRLQDYLNVTNAELQLDSLSQQCYQIEKSKNSADSKQSKLLSGLFNKASQKKRHPILAPLAVVIETLQQNASPKISDVLLALFSNALVQPALPTLSEYHFMCHSQQKLVETMSSEVKAERLQLKNERFNH